MHDEAERDTHTLPVMSRGRTRTTRSTSRMGGFIACGSCGGRVGDGRPSLAQPIIYSFSRAPTPPPSVSAASSARGRAAWAVLGPHFRVLPARLLPLSDPPPPLKAHATQAAIHDARRTHAPRRDYRAPPWSAPLASTRCPRICGADACWLFAAAFSTYERECSQLALGE